MGQETEQIAVAVQEVAKTADHAIGATEKVGGFLAQVLGEPIREGVGILTDALRFKRWTRQVRFVDESKRVMKNRGINVTATVSPKLALPIFENATTEEDDSLQDIWARLLATALDPKTTGGVRIAYVDIARQMEPIDAKILHEIYCRYIKKSERKRHIAETLAVNPVKPTDFVITQRELMDTLQISRETYFVAIDNLMRLRCAIQYVDTESFQALTDIDGETDSTDFSVINHYSEVSISALGIAFVEACFDIGEVAA